MVKLFLDNTNTYYRSLCQKDFQPDPQRSVTSQSLSDMTQKPIAKSKEAGTEEEEEEIHRGKEVGCLRWQETDSGAAAAAAKKKDWPHRKASKTCDDDRSKLGQAVSITRVLQEMAFMKNAVWRRWSCEMWCRARGGWENEEGCRQRER